MLTKKEVGEILSSLLIDDNVTVSDKVKISALILDNFYIKENISKATTVIIDDVNGERKKCKSEKI